MPAVFARNWRKFTCARRWFTWSFYCSRPGGFFQTSGRFLLSSSTQFDQCNHLLPLRSLVNPSKLFLFQKKLDRSLLTFQCVIQEKTFPWKILQYRQNDRELVFVTFWLLPQFSSERIISSKSKIWSRMPLQKQCILYQI